jgi:uncharacterized protein YndB with AHSA1/START domain
MPVDVRTELVIDAPRELVAAYATDPANAPHWYANIRSVEWRTSPPVRVGSRFTFVAQFLGRRLEYTYEVVVCEPGERLVMRTSDGPFPMETTYEWEACDDGKMRMTLRNRGEPSGFARLGAPVVGNAMRQANRKDLARLAELLGAARR